jgi:hypothetical protein
MMVRMRHAGTCPLGTTRCSNNYASRLMNKPSERIVVFVSPAQKRAISNTAEELGISVSELMRRAVLNFGATSGQVKAASIVDRLRAPREPDALNAALQRVARSTRAGREALPPALRSASAATPQAADAALDTHRESTAQKRPDFVPTPVDPLQALSAMADAVDTADADEEARAANAQAAAEAAARVAAAKAAALKAAKAKPAAGTTTHDEGPFIDPAEGTGRFA